MNVLKAAIVGLALISGNTLVRADVITDWNKTAMDVMKAVNVAGNPWTRSMALVNVSMSDAVNSVQNRYSRYSDGASDRSERLRRGCGSRGCTRNSHAAISRPEGEDRCSLRGDDERHSGQPRTGGRHCFGRKSCGRRFRRTSERRDKHARHVPPAHHAWRVGADHAAALPAICDGEAVGHGQREPVPPGSAAGPQQRCSTRATTTKPRKWAERRARSGPTRSPTPCASGRRPTWGPRGSRRPRRFPIGADSLWQKARECSH